MPEDGGNARGRQTEKEARAPQLGALKGFQRISGVERKFFLIISSLFLVGSVNFSRRLWPELYGNQMILYMREIKDN